MNHLRTTLLHLIRQDGYCVGTTTVILPGAQPSYLVDASKDGQRWGVVADPVAYRAVVELMQQLGWELQ